MATRMDHDKADELLEQDLCRHTADLKPRTQPWAKQVLNTSANASFWTPVATACLPQGGNEVSSDRWAHQRSPLAGSARALEAKSIFADIGLGKHGLCDALMTNQPDAYDPAASVQGQFSPPSDWCLDQHHWRTPTSASRIEAGSSDLNVRLLWNGGALQG